MTKEKKPYFKRRTKGQIKKGRVQVADKENKGLVAQIEQLEQHDWVLLRTPLLAEKFRKPNQTRSQKALREGIYQPITQPRTPRDALQERRSLRTMIQEGLEQLASIPEERLFTMGYQLIPVRGTNRTPRAVPFFALLKGTMIFSYAKQETPEGITIRPYEDALQIPNEGVQLRVRVPSTKKKKARYDFGMGNIPIIQGPANKAIILGIESELTIPGAEQQTNTPYSQHLNQRYEEKEDCEATKKEILSPQTIAAYLAIIEHYNKEGNRTPFHNLPFLLPSRKLVELYKRLENNVLIHDPLLKNGDHLRTLYDAEKSIILGRAIIKRGIKEYAYCRTKRDGKLRDYKNWNWED